MNHFTDIIHHLVTYFYTSNAHILQISIYYKAFYYVKYSRKSVELLKTLVK